MGRGITIRFKDNKVSSVHGARSSHEAAAAEAFGALFVETMKTMSAPEITHGETARSDKTVEARRSPGLGDARPWLAYVDGVLLRSKAGVGRRFASEEAALEAARRVVRLGDIQLPGGSA